VHAPQQSETSLHRVILFAPQGEELLVLPEPGRLRLPEVSIPPHQRIAEHLTASVYRHWSQHAVCLFGLETSSTDSETHYEVMESIDAQRSEAAGLRRVSISSLRENQFEQPADAMAVARAIAECKEYAAGSRQGPFGRLGWFAELTEWVRDQICSAGFVLNGRFRQINASPTFSLVRFETNGPAVWFKAVGEPNLREYPITLALAEYFPAFVPHVFAMREDWNGWLAIEAEGAHPTESSDIGTWMRVATTLAELQIASVGRTPHLLETGCRDARLCTLSGLIEPFFEAMAELMERQTKESPPPLSRKQLFDLESQLQDTLAEVAVSEIPNAIGHLDFNPGNIVANHDRCVFLDWAEACVAHPFFTFQYLLAHLRRVRQEDHSWEHLMVSTYANIWQSFVSPRDISKALGVSPLLAVFAYAACGDTWRDPMRRNRPDAARHFRSLTRRMKRELDLLVANETQGSAACLS
jgi:Phosphotransferase enzyme family